MSVELTRVSYCAEKTKNQHTNTFKTQTVETIKEADTERTHTGPEKIVFYPMKGYVEIFYKTYSKLVCCNRIYDMKRDGGIEG